MKRIFSILVLLIMALSLCSCGSDYHDQLPYPFSEIRSGMSKDEILTKFESLGIKKLRSRKDCGASCEILDCLTFGNQYQ